jgi:hypothetical protein
MPSKKVVFLAILFVVIAGAVSLIASDEIKTFVLKDSCLENGGKWASNGANCIDRRCAANGTCLPNYDNNGLCSGLTLPISQDELYFQLGMPERQDGTSYTFTGGAMGNPITATIENEVVTELKCAL